MSTKTLRKRIALVAVSALGFGVLSVAPSSAATTAANVAFTASPYTATAGKPVAISFKLTTAGTPDTGDEAADIALTATVPLGATALTIANAQASTSTVVPAPGTALLRAATSLSGTTTGNWTIATATASLTVVAAAAGSGTAAAALTGAGATIGSVVFTPKTSGTYTFTLTNTGSELGTGTATSVATVNVAAASASAVVSKSNPRIDLDDISVMTGAAVYSSRLQFVSGPSTQTATGLTTGAIFSSASTGVIAGASVSGGTNYSFDTNTAGITEGAYVFRAFDDVDYSGTYNTGDSAGTLLTVTAALDAQGAYGLALQKSSVATNGTNAVTMTATVSAGDSEGNTSYWLSSETVTIEAFLSGSTTASTAVTASYSAALGYATVTIGGTAAVGEYTVKAKGPGGSYADTGSSAKFTVLRNSGTVTGLTAVSNANLVFDTTSNGVGSTTNAATITASKAATTITFNFTGGNYTAGGAVNVPVTVTPAVGTSVSAVTAPTMASVNPDGTGSFVVTNAAPTSGDSYVVSVPTANGTLGFTVTYASALPQFRTVNQAPAAAYTAKTGSTNTLSAILDDGYGVVQAAKSVTVTVAGRNPSTSIATTDAAGKVSYTLVDAGAVATGTSDTVTFSHAYISSTGSAAAATATFTVTYTATGIVVGNVLVTASATTATPDTVQQLGVVGANAKITYTATVSDASGLPLPAGHVVVFTGGADDKFVGASADTTDASGQATVVVYRNLNGYANITATVYGVSGSHSTTKWTTAAYANANTTVQRNIVVTKTADAAAGGIVRVTAKVTDRWGNPVVGVPVGLSLVGAGRLFGSETAAGTTDVSGLYQWNVTTNAGEIGDAVITVATTGAAGQTLDIADRISNGGTTYVVSGVSAGNYFQTVTAKFTKDTSTSTADALLALAQALGTKDQASATVDAAAEATDAANAATDAANYAAEAADAATAAAQDASDAVAALSAQVSEAIAGLKKQLVSLTNLVIKIQKKVKA
jgi:hypothetical protein